jgi:hypothetical protein
MCIIIKKNMPLADLKLQIHHTAKQNPQQIAVAFDAPHPPSPTYPL